MKRLVPFLFVLLGCFTVNAAPVGVDEAGQLAVKFVQSTFDFTRQSDELTLVYSQQAFYVYNVGEYGFVIMSSDDRFRPVIGYSDESTFNPDDMAPALQEYLDNINRYRTSRNAVADIDAACDWTSLRDHGCLMSRYGGREADYLVQTKWNQNYPYNYCCPADSDGPGGHVYAGCVATAAAQVMKYWNHPLQGTGSHTYTPTDNPQYGPITVNFGEATYDWDNMPNTINSSSPLEQIEAVGQLIYHVGVSVDMNYRPTSSGAVTSQLCTVMPLYFSYTNQMVQVKRENHTHDSYMNVIKDLIDMSWPMVHKGGGHAYVLDGYDDFGLVHFNWGWSGSNDGWFDVDDHNYTDGESFMANYVPAEIYNATSAAPTNLVVTPATDGLLSATVVWNNPVQTLTNQPLTSIDQIVVMRDSKIIYTEDNVTPGASMSFVDNNVPYFSSFRYTVYAVINGQRGSSAKVEGVHVGPTCPWKFVVSSSNMMGWRGSRILIYDFANAEVGSVTINSSNPVSVNVDMPLGLIKLVWVPSEDIPSNFTISINVKDFNNNSLFSYSGGILDMNEGVFFHGNNGCGAIPVCTTPSYLTATQDVDDEQVIVLQWEGVPDSDYGYLVFRDDQVIALTEETVYRDEEAMVGGHCDYVTTLCEGGMSGEYSNMACEASGACYPPRNFNFEMTSSFKCKLTWDRPSPDDGLSGYYIYRKQDGEEYTRIKLLSANATSFTDNSLNSEGDYYYKIVAHYNGLDCDSPPAAYLYDENQYYIHFLYSFDAVDETNNTANIYPNPTSGMLNVEMPSMLSVSVYNMMGQCLVQKDVNGDSTTLNLKDHGKGVFMVMVKTADGIVTKKVSVIE